MEIAVNASFAGSCLAGAYLAARSGLAYLSITLIFLAVVALLDIVLRHTHVGTVLTGLLGV